LTDLSDYRKALVDKKYKAGIEALPEIFKHNDGISAIGQRTQK